MTTSPGPSTGQGEQGDVPERAPLPAPAPEPRRNTHWWFRMWNPTWRWLLPILGADPATPPTPSSGASPGRWPSTKQSFWWDLGPDDTAPKADGLVAPTFEEPPWVAQAASKLSADELAKLLVAEHERNLGYQASTATSEGKASRLLTPIVGLLTADATLVAFELNTATGRHNWWALIPYIGAGFGAVAAFVLVAAALRALDADTRVGMFNEADPLQRARPGVHALADEVRGSALARWSSINKSTRIMYARAALSRSMLLITLALLLGAATVITGRWAFADSSQSQPACQHVAAIAAPTLHGRPRALPAGPARLPGPTRSFEIAGAGSRTELGCFVVSRAADTRATPYLPSSTRPIRSYAVTWACTAGGSGPDRISLPVKAGALGGVGLR